MGFSQLRRFDVQAKVSLVLSLGSVMPLLGAAGITWRNYDHKIGQIVHGEAGAFVPVFLACVGLSAVAGAIAAALGLSSAGQRRNDKPAWSWIGFILGSAVVASNFVLLLAYWMLRLVHHAT